MHMVHAGAHSYGRATRVLQLHLSGCANLGRSTQHRRVRAGRTRQLPHSRTHIYGFGQHHGHGHGDEHGHSHGRAKWEPEREADPTSFFRPPEPEPPPVVYELNFAVVEAQSVAEFNEWLRHHMKSVATFSGIRSCVLLTVRQRARPDCVRCFGVHCLRRHARESCADVAAQPWVLPDLAASPHSETADRAPCNPVQLRSYMHCT
eukprot:SAG11_NODE_5200_length_1632_cov_1.299413_3_plen_205_part_00